MIVQNGSGEPGVGESVAVKIIPAGFRIVLSQNAQTFDVGKTDVFANGPDHEARGPVGAEGAAGRPSSRRGGTIEHRRHHDRGGEGLHGLTRDQGTTAGGEGALPPSRDVAIAAARAAAEKQATDITVLDVSRIIVITDFFVICSAGTQRQIRSVIDAVEEALRGHGVKPMRREGEPEAGWWLLDYVDVVVHVFGEEERAYYDLERLWSDAPEVAWAPSDAAATGR